LEPGCGIEYLADEELHRHLKAHKIRVSEYYVKHYPKFDLYTKEPIPFKNKEQYFDTDFLNRVNLKNWLKSRRNDEAKRYCLEVLERRIKKKGLYYVPTQVELRSTLLPPINYYNSLFGDFSKLCASYGLKERFQNIPGVKDFPSIKSSVSKIIIDTREQKPVLFDFPFEIDSLSFGDYGISDPSLNEHVFVERKSLSDFIGTLNQGYERFTYEIERAAVQDSYLVVVVEDSLGDALSFNLLPHIFAKVRPECVFFNVREILQKYDNVQFVFLANKREASGAIQRILFEKGLARSVDLQLMYDMGLL
jgi:hypothetical protein